MPSIPFIPSYRAAFSVGLFGLVLLLAGCQTPDLKPFAAATATVAAGITQGGDLALKQIAREPALVDNSVVEPDAPNHPAKALAAEWENRRRATEAILAYSGALAAISDAAANRKANATALFDAVKQLASAVPGVSLGSNAAGNLLISTVSGIVEIKAWRDMGAAVKNADAAIGIIAGVFRKDLEAMANLQAGFHTQQIIQAKIAPEYRQLTRLHEALRKEQQTRRGEVAGAPADARAGTELARIDALITGVEHDLNPRLAAMAQHRTALAEGASFYQSAIRGVDAWAAAHHDLAAAFEQKRTPNIALLIARAQEIQGQLQELKSANPQPATP